MLGLPKKQHDWLVPVKKMIVRQHNEGVTTRALRIIEAHARELGKVDFVELVRPFGDEVATSEVRFVNEAGAYIEVDGLSWGYGGEGPRGLSKAFKVFGIPLAMPQIAGWTLDHFVLDVSGQSVHYVGCTCAKR